MWNQIQPHLSCAVDFVGGGSDQFIDDQTLGVWSSVWRNFFEPPAGNDCLHVGRATGRTGSTVLSSYLIAQGAVDLGAGGTLLGASGVCAVASFGFCAPVAAIGGGAALTLVLKGTVEAAYGTGVAVHIRQNPLPFYMASGGDPTLSYGSNTGDTGRNADILRRNMGVGQTPGQAAHHIVPSTHPYDFARQAREILQRLGIDINSAANGVLLRPEIHNGLANNYTYMQAVANELGGVSTNQQSVAILHRIGQRLLNGTFPR